jgi:hypothetical protein
MQSMSEEHNTYSPLMGLGQLEPYPVTIARLTAERDKYEGMLKAAQQLLIARGNDLLAARAKVTELECRQAAKEALRRLDVNYSPTGRIESLEARITALEALVNAR